jgi:dTDP-4-amino-4,6-dideoxygalactose transaminase
MTLTKDQDYAKRPDSSSLIPLANLARQHAELAAPLHAAIDAVFASSAFISGPFVEKFERAYSERLGSPAVRTIGVSNGTSAISLVLEALGIGAGDEVILPGHTFIATAEAVRHVGATPVLCDIETASYTADPASIASLVTERTKAVLPVHLNGIPADIDAIAAVLPRDRPIAVVEDAAQAHLATLRGRPLGTIGIAGTFSFFPAKNLGACGDAGAVVTRDAALAERVAKLRNHGRVTKYEHDIVGYNHRMDGLQGAILAVKLAYLPAWNARRRLLAEAYDARLRPAGFKTIEPNPDGEGVYHLYVVEVSNRDAVQAALDARGIASGIHYPVPLHRQPALRRWARGALPHTERIVPRILSLPLCPYLSDDELDRIVEGFHTVARP